MRHLSRSLRLNNMACWTCLLIVIALVNKPWPHNARAYDVRLASGACGTNHGIWCLLYANSAMKRKTTALSKGNADKEIRAYMQYVARAFACNSSRCQRHSQNLRRNIIFANERRQIARGSEKKILFLSDSLGKQWGFCWPYEWKAISGSSQNVNGNPTGLRIVAEPWGCYQFY